MSSRSSLHQQVQTHKSRMGYWWDFCPRMVHQGIWDDVSLEISGPVRVQDVFIRPQLAPDHTRADLSVAMALDTTTAGPVEVQTSIAYQGQQVSVSRKKYELSAGQTTLQMQMEIWQPHLWWPNGYGDHLEAVYPRSINILTFRYKTAIDPDGARTRKLSQVINESGKAYMTHAVIEGRSLIRWVTGQTYVEERHIREAMTLIDKCIQEIGMS